MSWYFYRIYLKVLADYTNEEGSNIVPQIPFPQHWLSWSPLHSLNRDSGDFYTEPWRGGCDNTLGFSPLTGIQVISTMALRDN